MYPQNEHPVARCQQMRRKIRKFPATATEAKTQEKLKQKILVELSYGSVQLSRSIYLLHHDGVRQQLYV